MKEEETKRNYNSIQHNQNKSEHLKMIQMLFNE
jgi:hypothetical protein